MDWELEQARVSGDDSEVDVAVGSAVDQGVVSEGAQALVSEVELVVDSGFGTVKLVPVHLRPITLPKS